tara:strand:+ start:295 stop:1599 length:1305 start_codon:yes stop_codon:yes gene_type:complete
MIGFLINPFKFLFTDKSISFDIIFFSTLLFLIPIALITGPAIPDIFLSLIALYFLIKSIWKKKWHYYQNPIFYGFIIFCLYGIIRSIFSEMPIESLMTGGSIFYFRYIFFALGVWYLLDTNRYLSKCLLNISIICIVFVCIDALYQYFFEFNIFGNKKHSDTRLTGLFGDEPIVGRYIAYLSTFIFILLYQTFFKQQKIIKLSVVFLILCEVTVFLSGERAPLFSFILFSFLIIIFVSNFRIYKIISVFISIIIILCITLFNPNAKMRIVDLSLSQVSQTQLPFLPYSDHHEEHYISALKMFQDNQFFGIGTNLFRFQCNKLEYKHKTRSCNTHPHNFYFQTLAELGIFGFGFLVIFFLYLVSIYLRKVPFIKRLNKINELPFDYFLYPIILTVNWWPLIPHMSFYNNWNNVLIMLPLGFFMRYFFGNKNGIID